MKFLKWLLSIVVLLIVALAVAGFFLPDKVQLERSIVMNAASDKIFPHVNDLKKWEAWSPWAERDPKMQSTYSGADAGVGAKVSWVSETEGSGSQEITESVENESVKTHLDFGDQGNADAEIRFEAVDEGTVVTWGFESEFGNNLIGRYFGLMMEKWLGPDYEKGLANLKRVAEAG